MNGMVKFLLLEEVDSTNSYVACNAGTLEDMTMVIADSQTAGRGQRGNSWESEPGCNLTFTLFHKPKGILPADQFAISEATALAVTDFLATIGIRAEVKWPNDIYVDDRKIAGILIEHAVTSASIEHSRIGVGLNVNQKEFRSDAPNPVSVAQLTGADTDISRVAAAVGECLARRLALCGSPEGRRSLHSEFKERLWRREGAHPFRRRDDGVEFRGVISDVDSRGPITITDVDTGASSQYAFKEIEFILNADS